MAICILVNGYPEPTIVWPSIATLGKHFFVYQVVTWSRHEQKVNILYLFGEYVLSADVKGNIYIWTFKGAEPNTEPVGSISLGDKFTPTCIMHPDTYLNKVLEAISCLFFRDTLCSKHFVHYVCFLLNKSVFTSGNYW
jgi:hypothetical protein